MFPVNSHAIAAWRTRSMRRRRVLSQSPPLLHIGHLVTEARRSLSCWQDGPTEPPRRAMAGRPARTPTFRATERIVGEHDRMIGLAWFRDHHWRLCRARRRHARSGRLSVLRIRGSLAKCKSAGRSSAIRARRRPAHRELRETDHARRWNAG